MVYSLSLLAKLELGQNFGFKTRFGFFISRWKYGVYRFSAKFYTSHWLAIFVGSPFL
jgi:hypothetical protein